MVLWLLKNCPKYCPNSVVKILNYVERVHLQNLLLGELLTMWLKFDVAPSGELTSIDEVVRGKTQLTGLKQKTQAK
jgi:hypothetical protein